VAIRKARGDGAPDVRPVDGRATTAFKDKSPFCLVAILTWVAYAGDGRHLLRREALDATPELKRRCGLQNIFNLGMIAPLGRARFKLAE
jgi:hypothetical protein